MFKKLIMAATIVAFITNPCDLDLSSAIHVFLEKNRRNKGIESLVNRGACILSNLVRTQDYRFFSIALLS